MRKLVEQVASSPKVYYLKPGEIKLGIILFRLTHRLQNSYKGGNYPVLVSMATGNIPGHGQTNFFFKEFEKGK